MGPELPGILPRTHMYSECLGMVESPQIAIREENHSPCNLIFPNSNSVLGICLDTNPVMTLIWSLKQLQCLYHLIKLTGMWVS